MNEFSVYKCNSRGEVVWQYQGRVVSRGEGAIVIEAFFNREDLPFLGIVLRTNDRFIETFYTDRWYNIFEIHDRQNFQLKGWYCNIGRPAVLNGLESLSYEDLALDLWVTPEGVQQVLDEDEFVALDLDQFSREKARAALAELQNIFHERFNKST